MSIGPGARVGGRYLVLEEIGRGGMGVVYLARDEESAREVALKVLREAPQGEAKRRLQREARAMNALDPRGVAQVLEIGQTSTGELYLAMEYVRGKTVGGMQRTGRVGRSAALRIIGQVADTLGHAHRAGLVHRDVKPDNIMVCDDGRVVLLDFGIVKHIDAGEDTAHISTQLTAEGSVIGTPAYLSPEQALGREVGPATDQFALGVTAFQLLTGKLPWTATEMTTVLAQVLAEVPPPASTLESDLPPAFDHVLSRALSKSAARRFATIDDFAKALTAAERGEYVPFEESPTILAPGPRTAHVAGAALRARRTRWVAAIAVVLAFGSVVALRTRHKADASAPKPKDSVATALSALGGADANAGLACPILDVHGVPDIGVRLGAAAASLVCARANWYLGGRDDRILPPAKLLDLSTQPVADATDPYVGGDGRQRTLDLARARGAAYADGVVTHAADSWQIDLVLRAPDGREAARSHAEDASFMIAVGTATEALWRAPLNARPVLPEVTRWTAVPDAEIGIAYTDLLLVGPPHGCEPIRRRAGELRGALFNFVRGCEGTDAPAAPVEAGSSVLDESSLPALLLSAPSLLFRDQLPLEERRRVAVKLESGKAAETSSFAHAQLDLAAGFLWWAANEPERAHAAYSSAVQADPLLYWAWQGFVATAEGAGTKAACAAAASAWFPCDALSLVKAGSYRGDELDVRLRDAQLAYILDRGFERAMHLGRAYAEAGREDEALAVASAPVGDPESNRALHAFVTAFVDLHRPKLQPAMTELLEAGNVGVTDILDVARVAGRVDELTTAWTTRFLALPDDQVDMTVRGYEAPMVLCMSARRDLAKRCLDRVARLGHATANFWGEGGDALLEGAKRYASGDVHGAVSLWRPLVAGPTTDIARLLPTEAFERAGQPELAARLDARKLPYTFIAGVSEAAPREAKRLVVRGGGDKAKGIELAKKVINAWENADLVVPAVAEMRALVKQAE